MEINLNEIIPLGRSYNEYIRMFGINGSEDNFKILDCGSGPSDFNCVMNEKGNYVISIDPIYKFTKMEIEKRINETFDDIISQTEQNKNKFVWSSIKSIEELAHKRRTAMNTFLKDFDQGKIENRYISAELPSVPFENAQFDLAISSHFLFLYENILSYPFHEEAISEMLRVAKEVRIFPLLDLNANRCSYVDTIINDFTQKGYLAHILTVDYEFQKGGNQYLKIIKARPPA